ncbi:unknown [Haloarcula marismortui ATCC 43049]|uniref:Potassium transporter TrkA n=1 Tax=Haloarcula marismortui (strain ATCC 43049 / DSM 3752 / JCM 8966 / VKM B-1809) TaxID=272569 RepID=Q5UX86_HALMA|nr:TrkA C-terminal domain-containing protein [Haloarcula marismortui]AAV48117.1 unknown [Haloarcula marismortui ATCC 43049]QCP92784.1 potassium transporter TrkA [Haloarcula marismortui ATCC 43049]
MTPLGPTLLAQIGANLQLGIVSRTLVEGVVWLLAITVLAATPAGAIAVFYRWYVRERIQTGLALLFGLTAVVLVIGATTALSEVILGDEDVLAAGAVLLNLAAFLAGGVGAYGGMRMGDRLGVDLFAATGGRNINADVSEIVQTVGRVTSVRLPEDIDDIIGYDPMPDETKETLANRRFLFPRRLTKDELRDRLVARLKTDYGVGHVDVELADDGTVDYLAVGSRAAGIGPTLPPSTNAVAIQADPAHAASAGDLVQVWEQAPAKRVLTGELRGVADDVVTVAIDAADTPKLDPQTRYKLVTLPVQDRSDREFASLLRAADETMGTATVEPGSTLDGAPVGSLAVSVVAITRDDTAPETIPSRERVLAAGDTIYAIATPDALRRLEQATEGTDEPGTTAAVTDELGSDTDGDDGQSGASDAVARTEQTDGTEEPAADATAATANDGAPNADATETEANDTANADADTSTADTAAADEPTETAVEDESAATSDGADAPADAEAEAMADTADSDESPDDDPLEALRNTDMEEPSDDLTADEAFDDLPADDGDDTVEVWDPEERIAEADGEPAADEANDSDSIASEAPTEDGDGEDDESTAGDDSEKPN